MELREKRYLVFAGTYCTNIYAFNDKHALNVAKKWCNGDEIILIVNSKNEIVYRGK